MHVDVQLVGCFHGCGAIIMRRRASRQSIEMEISLSFGQDPLSVRLPLLLTLMDI
jgi:hypothetical protein